jgi:hypothetical protein
MKQNDEHSYAVFYISALLTVIMLEVVILSVIE